LTSLLGRSNLASESIHNIENNRFAASTLDGKLGNIYPDVSSMEISHTGKLKSLVAGDAITVEKNHKPAFSMKNRAKFISSPNQLPQIQNSPDAWFRR
jgi:phage/plasmid-associated DNA primase